MKRRERAYRLRRTDEIRRALPDGELIPSLLRERGDRIDDGVEGE
jgi:hypothetical protein